ncbi:MAG: Maf family protein [Bacteroidia bacterium]|nr:Maf family protein [Bacteroidia bacterium]MCX7764263.1 Maf family protein [Bacteroidia bacterium]MDW8057679.1 Maf family protein [Bacteroidia bacterium]
MKVILVSASPRRKALLELLGWQIELRPAAVEETLVEGISPSQQAMVLALRKLSTALPTLQKGEVAIAADTIVYHAGQILGKPRDIEEARHFLYRLSGQWHIVYTGVAVGTVERSWSFYEETAVRFHSLSKELVESYLQRTPPLDKAGAYGAQDLIGLVGIAEIRGDFYNVMGLPVQKLARFWQQVFGVLFAPENK